MAGSMSSHGEGAVIYVVAGVLLIVVGALVVRYPEETYALRTAWKHDGDVSLAEGGRTDQRLMGGIVALVGLGLLLAGVL